MTLDRPSTFAMLAIATALLLAAGGAARADDDDEEEGEHERFAISTTWQAECGSCHVAYPPRLLPTASWDAIFAGLGNHFGSDASLDAATAARLLAEARADSPGGGGSTPPLRITETRWFRHEHDEVSAATWRRPEVGGPANCAACHPRAERGDYEGRRIPRSTAR